MKKKHWYDWLWVLSAAYLILGFFNILFAWLGLLCFFIPLLLSDLWKGEGLLQPLLRPGPAL